MINHDKLKLALELAQMYSEKLSSKIAIGIEFSKDEKNPVLGLVELHQVHTFLNIDDLIEKLEVLIKPPHKYKVGQTVYRIDYKTNLPVEFEIEGMHWDDSHNHQWCYRDVLNSGYYEDKLYSTKLELIEKQIEYWKNIKSQVTEEGV